MYMYGNLSLRARFDSLLKSDTTLESSYEIARRDDARNHGEGDKFSLRYTQTRA